MIRINLLLPEDLPKGPTIKMPRMSGLVGLGLFLLVLLPIGTTAYQQGAKLKMLRGSISEVQAESVRLKPVVERIHRLNQESRDLTNRLQIVRRLDGRRTFHVSMMDVLSELLPRHLWLTDVQEHAGGLLTIHGGTFSNLVVAELMIRLEETDFFTDVRLVQAERRDTEGRSMIQFEIHARLVGPQGGNAQ